MSASSIRAVSESAYVEKKFLFAHEEPLIIDPLVDFSRTQAKETRLVVLSAVKIAQSFPPLLANFEWYGKSDPRPRR
jgi:hypothetical protein